MNSNLISYTLISPNKNSGRNHKIDTVTIHCTAGKSTVESLGKLFYSKDRKASSNYGIGHDGKIGLYVDEKDRSWCSSDASNDHRAITIEVSSDAVSPYKVTDESYRALILLLVDICIRNEIQYLLWSDNKKDRINHINCNMTVHRDFANKACPGEFLYSHMQDIANKVNGILSILRL